MGKTHTTFIIATACSFGEDRSCIMHLNCILPLFFYNNIIRVEIDARIPFDDPFSCCMILFCFSARGDVVLSNPCIVIFFVIRCRKGGRRGESERSILALLFVKSNSVSSHCIAQNCHFLYGSIHNRF